jgi:hypothetical protein
LINKTALKPAHAISNESDFCFWVRWVVHGVLTLLSCRDVSGEQIIQKEARKSAETDQKGARLPNLIIFELAYRA